MWKMRTSYESSFKWGHDLLLNQLLGTIKWFTCWDTGTPTVTPGCFCLFALVAEPPRPCCFILYVAHFLYWPAVCIVLHNIYMGFQFYKKRKSLGSWAKSDNLVKAYCFEVCWIKQHLHNCPFIFFYLHLPDGCSVLNNFIFTQLSWRQAYSCKPRCSLV